MSEFKTIETQEDFDAAIQKRLDRKEKEVQERYKDFLSPEDADKIRQEYEKKLSDKDKESKEALEKYAKTDATIEELTKRAEDAEKSLLRTRIASESKLPYELASRIIGDTEEDMKKDAETLAGFLKPQTAPPAYSSTPASSLMSGSSGIQSDAAYMSVLSQLTQS